MSTTTITRKPDIISKLKKSLKKEEVFTLDEIYAATGLPFKAKKVRHAPVMWEHGSYGIINPIGAIREFHQYLPDWCNGPAFKHDGGRLLHAHQRQWVKV